MMMPESEAELTARIITGQMERVAAFRELAELGINASSADVEWWLSYTPQQRRRASVAFAILSMSYT